MQCFKRNVFSGLEREILQLKQVVAKQGDVIEQHEIFMESLAERMDNETTSYTRKCIVLVHTVAGL